MYKKIILSFNLLFALFLISCGPAAENRDEMVGRANKVADSIANLIKTAMKEAEMAPMNVIKVDTAAAPSGTVQPPAPPSNPTAPSKP